MKTYGADDIEKFLRTIHCKGFEAYMLHPDLVQSEDGEIDLYKVVSLHADHIDKRDSYTFLPRAHDQRDPSKIYDPKNPEHLFMGITENYDKYGTFHPFIGLGDIRCELRGMILDDRRATFHTRTGTRSHIERVRDLISIDERTQQILDAVKGELPMMLRRELGLTLSNWY